MTLNGTILPVLMLLLGVGMLVRTVAGGGGLGAVGILFGVLFCAAGAGRLWLEGKRHG